MGFDTIEMNLVFSVKIYFYFYKIKIATVWISIPDCNSFALKSLNMMLAADADAFHVEWT